MRKRGILICIIGMDGSGKTNLAKSLIEKLNKQEKQFFKYVHGMTYPILFRRITRIGRLLFRRKLNTNNYNSFCKSKKEIFRKYRTLKLPYSFFTFLEIYSQLTFKIIIPLYMKTNILCDRYYYDVIVDLALNLEYTEDELMKTLNIYAFLFPKPNYMFILDVPEEVAFKRKNDVPSIDYLRERRTIYQNIAKLCKIDTISGIIDIMELNRFVLSKISDCLPDERGEK